MKGSRSPRVPLFGGAATLLLGLLLVVTGIPNVQADLYCGEHNCYHVLEVEPTADVAEIRRAYRQLSLVWHPDRNSAPEATERFRLIATAYETLRDAETRTDYDYMLLHPEEVVGNVYRYYRRRAPKVDVTPIFVGTVSLISVLQVRAVCTMSDMRTCL